MWITFAAAGGLIAIPILIHLFNRTRYRKINWAAMEFLLAAYKKTRKRMQFEHLLLLLLRILAMACLAFAFFPAGVNAAARWTLDTLGISIAGATTTGKAQHLILVIDDTASMGYQTVRATHYDRALQVSRELVSGLQEGRDRVTILLASRVAGAKPEVPGEDEEASVNRELERLNRDVPVRDVRGASEYLNGLKPTNSTADFLAVLREAGRRVSSLDPNSENASIAIVSDFQNNQWGFTRSGDPQHQAYLELMSAMNEVLEVNSGSIIFRDIVSTEMANYAITEVELENGVIGPGIRPNVRVTIGNYGEIPGRSQSLTLKYHVGNGEPTNIRVPTDIAPGKTFTLNLELPPFQDIGTQQVTFELTEKDNYLPDNQRTLAVQVTRSIPVLIIDGYALNPKDSAGKKREGVDYFKLALSISDGGDGEDSGRITPLDVVVADATDLSTISTDKKRVVVVANLGGLDEAFVTKLEQFAASGNSVIFSMGPEVGVDEYNKLLWKEGKGLLPVQLVKQRQAPIGKLFHMLGNDLEPGSPLEFFGERPAYREILEGPRIIRTWMEMKTPQDLGLVEQGVAPTRVILNVNATDATDDSSALEDPASGTEGDEDSEGADLDEMLEGNPPLLVERRYGRGRVLVWGTTLSSEWAALWSTANGGGVVELGLPLYLFHEMVRKVAGGDLATRNLEVGEPFVRVLSKDEQRAVGYEVENPSSSRLKPLNTALDDERRQVTFNETTEPGMYLFKGLTTDSKGETKADYSEYFAVNMPARESNVQRLAPDIPSGGTSPGDPKPVIEQPLRNAGINVSFEAQKGGVSDATQAKANARREDVWMLFAGLAALCLLMEMGVSLWFGSKPE